MSDTTNQFSTPTIEEALSTNSVYEPEQLDLLLATLAEQGQSKIATEVIERQLINSRNIVLRSHTVRQLLVYGYKELLEAARTLAEIEKKRAALEAEHKEFVASNTVGKENSRQTYLKTRLTKLDK